METSILIAVARADLVMRWAWGAIMVLIVVCAAVMILSVQRWNK